MYAQERQVEQMEDLKRMFRMLLEDRGSQRPNKANRTEANAFPTLNDEPNHDENSGNVATQNEPAPCAGQPNLSDEIQVEDTGRSLLYSPPEINRFDVNPFPFIPINQLNPPNFSGDRAQARSWLRQYEDIMNVNGYNDEHKLKRARAYLSGEASQWYNTRMRLDKNIDWHALKASFLRHFCGIDGMAILRKKLSEIRQKQDEHPSSYLVRVIDLCMEFNPKMSDMDLVTRVSQGLNDDTFNHLAAVRDREDWTIDWITSRFEQFRHSSGRASREAPVDSVAKRKAPTTSAVQKPRDLATWLCFNCNQKGHVINDCKIPRDEARIKAKSEEFKALKQQQKEQNGATSTESDPRVVNSVLNKQARGDLPPTVQPIHTLACDAVQKPILSFNLNGVEVPGRIDTGADLTVIPNSIARNLNLCLLPWTEPALKGLSDTFCQVLGMSTILVSYGNIKRAILIAVVPDTSLKQPLWGMDLLQAFSLQLDFSGNETLVKQPAETRNDVVLVSEASASEVPHPLDKIQFGDLPQDQKLVIQQTLVQFSDVFSRDEYDIGRTSTVKHRIHLVDDKPVHKPPYRIPFRNRELMEEKLGKLIETGAIRESKSPYASPVFFVDKDHGKDKRLVADYRALNAKTVPDRTPMPHPEDVFGMLAGSKIFAKLDITSMFNQIEVDEQDVEKTAITTPFGLYECPLMPFGLINAPATAVRLMKEVLRDLDGKVCSVYFDDIIIFAPDIQHLVQRCTDILARLRKHNLKLKPSKCIFAVDSIHFLGHVVTSHGLQIDERRIEHVKNFPTPKNPSDVRSFHGLCSYNRKFIRNFAEIAKPLTPLMGKPSDFKWSVEAQQAFERLREALIKAPILVHFNPDANHELRTDASSHAIGAVLYQKHSEPEQTGVVLYHSKTLTSAQRNYSATERELLAAFNAIQELQHYLYGKKFTLVTDHSALSLLKNQKDPHQRLARWVAQLQGYEFDVVYKSGAKHLDADCMSRFISESANFVEDDGPQETDITREICHVTSHPQDTENLEQLSPPESIDIRAEQREDDFCNKFIKILESEELTEADKCRRAKNFTIQDGLLYRVRSKDIFVLAIPARRRAAVLLSCHDVPLAGHLGFSKTYSVMSCRYYWPKMRRDVKKFVTSCNKCQRRKAPNFRRQGFTKPLPIAEDVFDTIGIDLITKLPRSHCGYNTILVCTDNLSKYVISVPLRNELAETIIHGFFNHVIAKHGCPRLVISDRGANISGERSRDFFRLFGIQRQLTSPYHPQSNGQTERFNRTLKSSLTLFVNRNQKDWPDFVQAITFAYNISEHAVTRVTPFELVFGRKPRIPLDNVLDRSEFIDPHRPKPGVLSSETVNRMKEQILANQQANKRRLDSRLAPCTYKEGDLVLVERPTRIKGTAHKLTYSYLGPYKIRRQVNDLSFEIAGLGGHSGISIVHPCHLKRYVPRDNVISDELVEPTYIPRERLDLTEQDEQESHNNGSRDVASPTPSCETLDASEGEDEIPSPPYEPLSDPSARATRE